MAMNPPPYASLRDVYRTLFRHRGKAALFFLATMAATVLATILTPRTYFSESKLFVRLGRENATLDPTVTLGNDPVVVAPYAREDEINSIAAMLSSRAMLERVVDLVGPEVVLGGVPAASSSRPEVRHAVAGASSESADKQSRGVTERATGLVRKALFLNEVPTRERALRHLSRRISVQPVRKSSVLEVAYEAPTPELAQSIVSTLVQEYLDEHARLNRVPGSQKFFAEQAERLGRELAELEETFAKVKTQTGLASIEDQRIQLIARRGRLEDELLETEAGRAEAEARVHALRRKLVELPKERVAETTEGINDGGTDGIRQQFFALQLREKQAAAMYTDSHPRLQAIREEMAAAQAVLDREERTRMEVKTAPDSIYEQARLALATEEPVLESLTAKAHALKQQWAGVREQLNALTDEEVGIASLKRQIELREADYRRYAVNLEQARIDDALESQRMSNISLVQPASYEVRPVRPRTAINLAMGLLVGLCGSFGLAFFAEYLDDSFREPQDIERNLNIPSLVAIPRTTREAMKVDGRTGA